MLEKSKQSFNSAVILKDQGKVCYCMSAQCAYYSGLQLAMTLLMTIKGLDAAGLFEWYISDKNNKSTTQSGGKADEGKGNSHAFYIDQLEKAIEQITGSERVAFNVSQRLTSLKGIRVKAAYKEHQVEEDEIKKVISKASLLQESIPAYITQYLNKRK
ncbi:hypothetical protein DYBT9623_04403 [Dyadobacter sp. CECT 9623]|uniref:HEPN domain-containing protein n=1 Tax=Dyadobacter linearis TaxID=2823330 RepID=A0ABM8UVN0_9BACT|nr:hypothetical protein [Dyadobacter sp. CECT 9623]CAG5072863.1 hypothetical protein DYBT9623_04403 [Dyadobacter sp. CECT 9623]